MTRLWVSMMAALALFGTDVDAAEDYPYAGFFADVGKGELAEIRLKSALNEQLTQLESLKFEGYLSALFELNELVFVQYQKKKLDPEYFEAWERRTGAAMSVPRIQQFWAKTKTGYRSSFVSYIDGLLLLNS